MDTLLKLLPKILLGVGAITFTGYWIYLIFPDALSPEGPTGLYFGLIFYGLATAGSALVAWGLILMKLNDSQVAKSVIVKATAAGLGLLGLMRAGTALLPHYPFEQLLFLPVIEAILFMGLAVFLYMGARSQ